MVVLMAKMRRSLPLKPVNDTALLEQLKSVCFTKTDVRAGWYGPGIAKTTVALYKPLAKWANEHWYMYESFLSFINKSGNILDIGSGIGHSSVNLATLFPSHRVIALDMDSSAVKFASTYNKRSNLRYECKNIFDYKTNKRFSYIFALEILEHIPALLHDQFIDKALSLLSPSGMLFITTPNSLDEKDAVHGHVGFLSRARARRLLEKYGNNVVHADFINNKLLYTGKHNKFIVQASILSFEKNAAVKSHFRIVMRNNEQVRYKKNILLCYGAYLLLNIKRIVNSVLAIFFRVRKKFA